MLTFTPSFFSKAGSTSLYRFSRPSAVYSTTASAAWACIATPPKAAAATSAGSNLRAKPAVARREFVFVMSLSERQKTRRSGYPDTCCD
jgi:hypothetical protein